MKKMENYINNNQLSIQVNATGLSDETYADISKEYDVILMGPQVKYRLKEVRKNTNKPVAAIPATDYALGNAEKVIELAKNIRK